MKYLIAVLTSVAFALALIPSTSTAACQYSSESSCESAGCFWCERCSGKEINNYGNDRCIASSLDCFYSCSKICGATCTADVDCTTNLTDTTCFYDGRCGNCSCLYESVSCPKNGTVINGICYYGTRSCTSTGCSISSCALREGEVCHPDDGCITQEEERVCIGDDVFVERVISLCTATSCNYTTTNEFVEKCKNGCEDGKCNKELCNINGINTDCDELDGYYGSRYCKGNDIYASYRDYRCGTNECVYTTREVKQESCTECQNGRCFNPGVVVNITVSSGPVQQEARQEATNLTTVPPLIAHSGGRVYNGFFFGSNEINLNVEPKNGEIKFRVMRSNGPGSLMVEADNQVVFSTKSTGDFSVSIENNKNVKFYAASSGWIFFMPTVYDVSAITVIYEN